MDNVLEVALSNAVVSAGLAILALLAGRFARRPALAHGLWVLVLLKLLTPPLIVLPVLWTGGDRSVADEQAEPPASPTVKPLGLEDHLEPVPLSLDEVVVALSGEVFLEKMPIEEQAVPGELVTATPTASTPWNWRPLALVTWSTGTLLLAGLTLWRVRRFHQLLAYCEPAPRWLQNEVRGLTTRLDLRTMPQVWLMPGRLPPMLWSLGGTPRLLIPAELLPTLTPSQRATLLTHELAHLSRGDHWVRWLESLAMVLYWWHPVVWWARRELREVEEQCCDAWVVWALPGAGRAYATALVECLDFLSEQPKPLPVGASGIGRTEDLKRRLTMIMRGMTPRRLTWGSGLLLLALGLFVVPVAPTFARADDDDDREEKRETKTEKPGKKDKEEGASKDVKAAQAEVEKLTQELREQTAKLREIEAKLKAAASKLGQAGVKDRVFLFREILRGPLRVEVDMLREIPEGQRKIIIERLNKGDAKGGIKAWLEQLPEGQRKIILQDLSPEGRQIIRIPDVPAGALPPTAGGMARVPNPPRVPKVLPPQAPGDNNDPRIREMERKLDEMMRQMEELRRQLRSNRSGAPEGDVFYYRFNPTSVPKPTEKKKEENKGKKRGPEEEIEFEYKLDLGPLRGVKDPAINLDFEVDLRKGDKLAVPKETKTIEVEVVPPGGKKKVGGR